MPVNATTPSPTTAPTASLTRLPPPGYAIAPNCGIVPLGDKDVWDTKVGSAGHALDTASRGVGPAELQGLLAVMTRSPAEFLSRLAADSENGTPVKYTIKAKKMQDFGIARLDVKVENRKLEATITFQVTNKSVNAVTAQYADKKTGPRLTAELKLTGDIDPATASIDNFSVGLDVKNLLTFDAHAIDQTKQKLKEFSDALKKLDKKDPQAAAVAATAEALTKALQEASLVAVLMEIAHDDKKTTMRISREGEAVRAKVELGDDKFAVDLENVLGKVGPGFPKTHLVIAGGTDSAKNKVALQSIRFFHNDKLSLSFEGGAIPKLYKMNKDGTRTELKGDAGMLIAGAGALPMLLNRP
ncbi:MAG: hypothetical protein A2138_09135 [Deltaproteobacteria bacterium RBG_16_71_12]|nr:MAG: hypothetical protein A2138_09135 [Deltaproteobacteria bacterium RBG_16_71_12]